MRSASQSSRSLVRLLVAVVVGVSVLAVPAAANAAATCANTTTTTYNVDLCLTAPGSGATLVGDTTVTATATVNSGTAVVAQMTFTLDGSYLITDFQSPFTFTLPSARYLDGAHTLAVTATFRDATTSNPTSEPLTFSNGTTTPWPGNTTPFTPATGTPSSGSFIVAAAGDGAGGETTMTSVVNMVKSWKPNLLLYLGDVYEKGSPTEFANWYTPGYGQFQSITDPIVGNHEYQFDSSASGYFSYWGPNSNTYSFDAGGWHFIALDANAPASGPAGQAQLTWLNNDLAAHPGACTIAMWHEPLFNIGPEGVATRMQPFWAALANAHASLVLNGHDHTYQRWTPMDANGNPAGNGVTEIVAGVGGHSTQTITGSDPRVVKSLSAVPAYGALKLTLSPTAVKVDYDTVASGTFDSVSIPCLGHPTTGSVSGTVTDASSGQPLSGASVTSGSASTTTDTNGNYTLANLAIGTDAVTVADGGYKTQTAQVAVSGGVTASQSFALKPLEIRYAGADRFATAASVSSHTFPASCNCTAYIATAFNFPDALAAAAAAGTVKGPVLLAAPTAPLDTDTANELTRLKPNRIVIVGGTAVVGTDVEAALAAFVPGGSANVARYGGTDRFATAAAVSSNTFAANCNCTAYIATAFNFPDALAGAAAAGSVPGPVLLVSPTGRIASPTTNELTRLKPNRIVILGSTAVVGTDVEAALAGFVSGGATNVARYWSADRFGTAASISAHTFAANCNCAAYIATAFNFPDALSGAAAAGTVHGPVLLVAPTGAIDSSTANELTRLKPSQIIVLGSTGVVGADVYAALSSFVTP